MQNNGLLVTIAVILIGATMWFLKSADEVKKNLTPVVQQVSVPATPTPTLIESPTPSVQRIDSAEAQALQTQLKAEQQALAEKQALLAQLQAQQQAAQAQGAASTERILYSSQMSLRQSEVENLNRELDETRERERQIDQATEQSMATLNTSAQQLRLQLEDNIRSREKELQQVQNEVTFWQQNTQYLDQRDRLAEAQGRYETQRSQLEALQVQRAQLPEEVLQQNSNIQLLSVQAKADLAADQGGIQQRISSLHDEIQRLQTAQSQGQMSRISVSAQIWQTQQEINEQNNRVQNLERQLKEIPGESGAL